MSEKPVIPKQGAKEANRASRRGTVLLTLLLGLALIAILQFAWSHRRSELDVRLHSDSEEAMAALEDILAKTPPEQRKPLLLNLREDPNPGTRYAAVDALGKEKGADVADALEQAYQDSASIVRQRAMEVLPGIDRDRGLHLQLAALRDEDYWMRDAASLQMALLIGKPGSSVDKRALPMLVKALDDPDEAVQVMSLTAIKKLTGQKWIYPGLGSIEKKKAVLDSCRKWWAANQSAWQAPVGFADVTPVRPTRSDPAPNFALNDIEGHRISLSGQKGHITLLNFWGTWCGPCQKEVPDLIRLDQEYHGQGVDIIGIALSEKKEKYTRWCQTHGVTYRQAFSTDSITEEFGDIHEVPVSILLDAQGRIRYRWEGERNYATFRAAIEHLRSEARP